MTITENVSLNTTEWINDISTYSFLLTGADCVFTRFEACDDRLSSSISCAGRLGVLVSIGLLLDMFVSA